MNTFLKYFFFAVICLCSPLVVFAKTDLSIAETDLTFSKDLFVVNETVKIYARIFNVGDTDVSGFVVFSDNDKEISIPQQISVRPNTYDDVFIDWKAVAGNNIITAKIIGTNPSDENTQNNSTKKKDIFVGNLATSQNETTNTKDSGSNVSNNQTLLDTLTNNGDTLGNIGDALDSFAENNPIKSGIDSLDKKINDQIARWYNLGLRNNIDPKKNLGSLFDPSKWTASLMSVIGPYLKGNTLYIGIGVIALLLVIFFFFKKKKGYQEED